MKLKWQQAPVKTQWGDEMVVASVAIDNDHTLSLYCERDQTPKVDAMLAQQEPVAKDNSNYRFDPPGLDPSHQKPVAWWIPKAKQFCLPSSDGTRPFAKAWEPLYTSPPAQRPWVGLTDEEIKQFASKHLDVGDGAYATHFVTGDVAFARAIEAAHNIKENT